MIQRVYEQASKSDATEVFVATDDWRIADAVEAFSGEVVMTSADHPSGTDRVHEAASKIGLSSDSVIVNVQGDEPLIPPGAINQVAAAIKGATEMATLCEAIVDPQDAFNPNVVKVAFDQASNALYFSRATIPWVRGEYENQQQSTVPESCYRHLGIYAYTVDMLNKYVSWPPTKLEALEKLEQLRVLEHGVAIRVLLTESKLPVGIDVPEDVPRVLAAIRENL